MALKSKRQGVWLSRLHFLSRFLGLTGLLVAAVGLMLVQYPPLMPRREAADLPEGLRLHGEDTVTLLRQVHEQTYQGPLIGTIGGWMVLGALPALGFALLIELIALLTMTAGRRSLAGSIIGVQVLLALAVLVGLNVYSFQHYQRIDLTRPGPDGVGQFTLSPDVQKQLRQLRGETNIVVLQQRRQARPGEDKREAAYVAASEEVIVQKVRDLVEQMREFGPQFRVQVLNANADDYDSRLKRVTADRPRLAQAIKDAPDSSIFFYAESGEDSKRRDYVRRLSFDEFYQLDKTRSLQAEHGAGNLVLQEKGVQRFINCALNVDEPRPRVGILVVHELLTSQGNEDVFTLKGLRESLSREGFDVVDVVTARWGGAQPQPAVDTFQETKYERLTDEIEELKAERKTWETSVKGLKEALADWRNQKPDFLEREYARLLQINELSKVTPDVRRRFIELLEGQLEGQEQLVERLTKSLEESEKERAALNVDESAMQRRMTDLQAKLKGVLADCDLLFIPRLTIRPTGQTITYNIHRLGLDASQAAVIRGFLADGKPVLASFGPSNEQARRPDPIIDRPGEDEIEQLLGELGIHFGKQTVLFTEQTRDFASRSGGLFQSAQLSKIPSLDLEQSPPAGLGRPQGTASKPNPLRESLKLTSQAQGKQMELELRYPRPVYFDAEGGEKALRFTGPIGSTLVFGQTATLCLPPGLLVDPQPAKEPRQSGVFLLTARDSWNDAQPFPTPERRVPRYQPPKDDDPTRGTPDEMRRGPFPVGVAVEAEVPEHWRDSYLVGMAGGTQAEAAYSGRVREKKTVRVAAIGHGGVFVDTTLSPAREELLLDTCNWLLGRDEQLNRATPTWSYPRVQLGAEGAASPEELAGQIGDRKILWKGGAVLLSLFFAFLGCVVLLARGVR